MTLLLNGWPRTIAETMATATKFMKFSWLFCFRYNSSLTNSTQFGNDSNYSKFNGENIATNCSRITALALDRLTKKHFGHYAHLKIFSLRSPSNVYFVSKHLGHFIRSTKVLGWKPFTVGGVFVYTVIAIHTGPDLLQLSFQVLIMV